MLDKPKNDEGIVDSAEVARRLRADLKRSGLRPIDLASKVGMSPQAVNGWLKTGRIAKHQLVLVAGVFGRPVIHYIGRYNKMPASQDLTVAELCAQYRISEEGLHAALAVAAASIQRPEVPSPRKKRARK